MRTLLTRLLLIGVAVLATPALAASDTWNGDALGCETFGNSGNYVQKIFMAYLGRPAAPAALEYYASFIDQDAQQGKLILFDDLYYSAEAQQLYRSMPLADQINQFYVLMFGREAKTEGIEYWVGEIEAGRFTVPAAAAYIADAAAVEDLAVLDAKQVAASKVTCAIGDDVDRLSAFQSNLDEARSSLAEIVTAEQAEAYTGYEDLIAGGADPANPYLIPSMVIDDAMSLDPAKDYVWSHIESLDITQDLGMECHDPSRWNFVSDSWYNLRKEDLNSDQYPDYLVAISCFNDLTYQGKSIRYDYDGQIWSNGFISMFCGSEDGLYNCTEEVTGLKDVIDFNGDILSGYLALPQIILHDLNEDGVMDIIVPTGNDFGMNPGMHYFPDDTPRDCTKGDCDFYQAYYDRMGLTRDEVKNACSRGAIARGELDPAVAGEKCWVQTSQAMYAVSGPDGTWEVKEFPHPYIFSQYLGSTELYLKDGEYHVNWRGGDSDEAFNWFTFNKQKNEFEFFGEGGYLDGTAPFDYKANNREYRIAYVKGGSTNAADARRADWIKIGDYEYQVQRSDPNKPLIEARPFAPPPCNDMFTSSRDECQLYQRGILRKDASGNVTKIMEYNLEDFVEESHMVDWFYVENGKLVLRDWNESQSPMGVKIHDIWMILKYGVSTHNLNVAMKQLEVNNPDAPWYLIVSIEGNVDLRYPGEKFVPQAIDRCDVFGYNTAYGGNPAYSAPNLVEFEDDRCWQHGIATVFKYEIDFENETLTYAGTLLDQPFIYHGLDSVGPDAWEWGDFNHDGWTDVKVVASLKTLTFASNEQGELMFVDSDQITPLMPYDDVREESDRYWPVTYDSLYNHGDSTSTFGDITNDGLTDFYAVVDGDLVNYSGKPFAQETKELYEPGRFYLDIVVSDYEPIMEADKLDAQQLRDRIDACIERARIDPNDGRYGIRSAVYCTQNILTITD